MNESPPSVRRRLRAARHALSAAQQREHATAAVRLLTRLPMLLHARSVALYSAADGELDPWSLMQRTPGRERRWYLPVLRRHALGRLWFVRYTNKDRLRANRLGIPEPTRRKRRIAAAHALDLILLPLVGFDTHCNRIGMGAGYYDRSLAFLRHRRHWRRPLLIGLAHECQRLDGIEPRPWDVPLDAVVTEARIYERVARG